jgi:hypothetical protein
MKNQTGIDTYRATPKSRILTIFCLLALLLAACASSTPISYVPEPTPASAVQPQAGSHPPVILQVDERQEVVNGYLMIYRDVYFTDPDGDAVAMIYSVVSSSLTFPLNIPDAPIEASAEQQKGEALFTMTDGCGQKVELTYEARIQDRAGNLSGPEFFTISCPAPQPLDTRPLLISGLITALPIALLLLFGFWLLFRNHPADRLPALQSTILMFLLFMILKFLNLVFHEGGHSLYLLVHGVPITLYVHPFFFSGFSRPVIDTSIWKDILGSATALPVGVLISLPFWKRRSLALLPLVMLFPFIALNDGINVMGIMGGDFLNVIQTNRLLAAPFTISGTLIVCIGLISLFSLFPLAGLDPRDNKALFVIPAAMFLWGAVSFLVAHLFVLGSPINLEFFMGREILLNANSFILLLIFGIVLAVLYITLFRKLYPRLPAWLRNETVNLTWKGLRLPAILWAVSLFIGLVWGMN